MDESSFSICVAAITVLSDGDISCCKGDETRLSFIPSNFMVVWTTDV